MSEPYLIAHKVRSQPAFDIAERIPCAHCQSYESVTGTTCEPANEQSTCHECDGLGYWWIIPTSGHRAYPVLEWALKDLRQFVAGHNWQPTVLDEAGPLASHPAFANAPDHYHLDAPARSRPSLAEALGLTKPKQPSAPIMRRI